MWRVRQRHLHVELPNFWFWSVRFRCWRHAVQCALLTSHFAWSAFFRWDESWPRLHGLDFLSIERLFAQVETPHGSHQLITQMDSAWLWLSCLIILSKSLWLYVFRLPARDNPCVLFWVSAEKNLLWSGPQVWASFEIEDRPFMSWCLMLKSDG